MDTTSTWHGSCVLRRQHRRRRLLVLAALLAISAAPAPAPEWAFPGIGAATSAPTPPDSEVMRLPGSPAVFHRSDFQGLQAIDWFPNAHPPAPEAVLRTKGSSLYACGYCHLPDGSGRPENARLQGLPADYIVEQVEAFASGARRAAVPGFMPTSYMAEVARAIQPADLKAAAAYFSHFEPRSHTQIVETATIPAAAAWRFVYRFDRSRHEAPGQRIIEGPADGEAWNCAIPEPLPPMPAAAALDPRRDGKRLEWGRRRATAATPLMSGSPSHKCG